MRLKKLDYIGISILIAGSYYPIVIYSFSCEPYIQYLYIIPITLLCLSTLYMTLSEFGLYIYINIDLQMVL